MGKKDRKIPVSDFISEKKLEKIMSIIERSDCVETAYDRIESLLEDDFEVKDLGTNRIILRSKKKKYDDLIFKVAGDKHGVEANFREFYNGDLDKRLTFSYSISKNGVFVVQERVKPFNSDLLEKYKKDIREMLEHLSHKLLLVDCKVKNFKNFGLRKNGDVCLLDHGDTVPLPEYQDTNIVNVDEESYVSLRCKGLKDPSNPKIKQCGGKLKYSKNFDYLECTKCGRKISVNDAYKEFYGNTRLSTDGPKGSHVEVSDEFERWADSLSDRVRDYCISTMNAIDDNKIIDTEMEESTMKEKIINGEKCTQVRGYWIPESLTKGVYAIQLVSVKALQMEPAKLLENGKKNPVEYRVLAEDHTPNPGKHVKREDHGYGPATNKNPINANTTSRTMFDAQETETMKRIARNAVERAIELASENGNSNNIIRFDTLDFFGLPVEFRYIREIFTKIKENDAVLRARFEIDNSRFFIEIKQDFIGSHEESQNDEDYVCAQSPVTVTRSQYLVNGVCCYKEIDYYVPVELSNGRIMTHDEAREALKSEGYSPKLFKINMVKALEVNRNDKTCTDSDAEFVSDEDDEIMSDVSSFVTDEDDDKSVRPIQRISDDDFDTIVNRPSRTNETYRNSVVHYKSLIDAAADYTDAIAANGNLLNVKRALSEMIVYNNNGICKINVTEFAKILSIKGGDPSLFKSYNDLTHDDAVVIQIIVDHLVGLNASIEVGDDDSRFLEFTDSDFADTCKFYSELVDISNMDDQEFVENVLGLLSMVYVEDNGLSSQITDRAICILDFLDSLQDCKNNMDPEDADDYYQRIQTAGVAYTADELLVLRNTYMEAAKAVLKSQQLDTYRPYLHHAEEYKMFDMQATKEYLTVTLTNLFYHVANTTHHYYSDGETLESFTAKIEKVMNAIDYEACCSVDDDDEEVSNDEATHEIAKTIAIALTLTTDDADHTKTESGSDGSDSIGELGEVVEADDEPIEHVNFITTEEHAEKHPRNMVGAGNASQETKYTLEEVRRDLINLAGDTRAIVSALRSISTALNIDIEDHLKF